MTETDNRGFMEEPVDYMKQYGDPNILIEMSDRKFMIAQELYKLADSIFKEGRELQAEAVNRMCVLFTENEGRINNEEN